jgi:hypothetical protein
MPDPTIGLVLVIVATVGLLASIVILRRQRREREAETEDRPLAVSTEGSKRCPACGMGNLWTDTTCISCGGPLPG